VPITGKLKVTQKNIEDVLKFTDEIVENYPRRLVGTDSCNNAGRRIAQEFKKNCDNGSIKVETFSCHPKSFLKHIRFDVILYATGTLMALLGNPFSAFLMFGLAASIVLSQSIFYFQIFDPFFPKATGTNIHGSIDPEAAVKQQIILCGHHDAAYVFNFMDKSPRLYPLFILAGQAPLFLALILSTAALILGINPFWYRAILIIGFVGIIPMWWFTTDKVSPGAGDNMIATSIINETAKIFSDRKKAGRNPLKHTRIICLSVDGEECGLRGSRAFAKAHEKEFKNIKTYAFCIDTLFNADKLLFFKRDLNMTVPLSGNMAKELTDIAKGLGYGAKVSQMPFGGGSTDAASFAQIGVEASCLLAFELDISNLQEDMVYHTPQDKTNAIEPKVVEQSLNVTVEYLLKKDKELL
jgi:hypothetical protein